MRTKLQKICGEVMWFVNYRIQHLHIATLKRLPISETTEEYLKLYNLAATHLKESILEDYKAYKDGYRKHHT